VIERGQLRQWTNEGLFLVVEPLSRERHTGWDEPGWIVLEAGETWWESDDVIERFSVLVQG
jgi:hypothetical protein